MQKIMRFLYQKWVAYAIGVMAFFNPFLFYLSTDFHTSFATAVWGIDVIVRVLGIVCAIGILGLLFVRNLRIWAQFTEHKATVITYLVMAVVTCLIMLANVIILILLSSSIPMARYYFAIEAPYLLGFGVFVSMAFVMPRILHKKTMVVIVVAVYALCGIMMVAADIWDMETFSFCSRPVVFDTGKDYSIVWSTTDVSTGYVTYTYQGVAYEVADANYGRLASARTIHHANVPYEHLDGNTYTVHATRMLDNAPYLAHRGKTLTTSVNFRGRPQGDVYMPVITDNHCLSRTKFDKVRYDEAYNAVLMLGDFSDFVHQELDISDFLLYPAWHLSRGEVPVLYAKGNHDTHSEMGADLAYLLGFDCLYYRTTYGEYTFTVLDSGSCNVDLEEEKYAGVGRYIPYRETELEWLEHLAPAAGYEIAVVHVWDFASVAEGIHNDQAVQQVARYGAALTALGTDFQLSGHKHDWHYFAEGIAEDGVPVPMLRCGGISAGLIGHSLTYTVLRIHDGVIDMTAYNTREKDAVHAETYTMSRP